MIDWLGYLIESHPDLCIGVAIVLALTGAALEFYEIWQEMDQ